MACDGTVEKDRIRVVDCDGIEHVLQASGFRPTLRGRKDMTHCIQHTTIEARTACWRAWLRIAPLNNRVARREELELDGVSNGRIDGVRKKLQALSDLNRLLGCERQREETEREFGGHCERIRRIFSRLRVCMLGY